MKALPGQALMPFISPGCRCARGFSLFLFKAGMAFRRRHQVALRLRDSRIYVTSEVSSEIFIRFFPLGAIGEPLDSRGPRGAVGSGARGGRFSGACTGLCERLDRRPDSAGRVWPRGYRKCSGAGADLSAACPRRPAAGCSAGSTRLHVCPSGTCQELAQILRPLRRLRPACLLPERALSRPSGCSTSAAPLARAGSQPRPLGSRSPRSWAGPPWSGQARPRLTRILF